MQNQREIASHREAVRGIQFLLVFASCGLAYLIPYDAIFDRVTLGVPVVRASAMFFCCVAGLWLQKANGFSLGVVGLNRPALKIGGAALVVAIWCVVLDGLVFRSILPGNYAAFEAQSLGVRLLYYCFRAFNENILYRLFLGSLFAWVLRRIWREQEHQLVLSMLGMVLAHIINIAANVGYGHFTLAASVWLFVRFCIPGFFWSWLYVRHGFATNEAAAIGVHLFLQPMVSLSF